MDGSTYINIFDTKGIEYLVIIAFLLLLIPFWLTLNKKASISRSVIRTVANFSTRAFNIPYGYFYSNNHTWAHLLKSGTANIGLDELLLRVTGIVGIKYLKSNDEYIHKGEPLAEISQKGKSLVIHSPVSGMFMNGNPMLFDSPGTMNEDPYGEGWICKIRPSAWKAETGSYYLAEEASQWLRNEMGRIRDFLAARAERYAPGYAPVILQDGGELYDNALSEMPDQIWKDFQKEFLAG